MIQMSDNQIGEPNCAAIVDGFMNTPAPITLPMMIEVADQNPIFCCSLFCLSIKRWNRQFGRLMEDRKSCVYTRRNIPVWKKPHGEWGFKNLFLVSTRIFSFAEHTYGPDFRSFPVGLTGKKVGYGSRKCGRTAWDAKIKRRFVVRKSKEIFFFHRQYIKYK